jgi:triosephosphate isomerase
LIVVSTRSIRHQSTLAVVVGHSPHFCPPYYIHRENLLIATSAAALGATAAYFLLASKKNMTRPAGSSEVVAAGERKYLIGGNWKCNGTADANAALIATFNAAGTIPSNTEVVVCAPHVYLTSLISTLREDMAVGAQDCGVNAAKGAYTGEVGTFMLNDIGATWVIIGHSERRVGFGMAGEPVELCATKCKVAVDAGLKVMFCIGESKADRESGVTMKVCAAQMAPLVKALDAKDWANISIAYEPVWAIGTGLTATPAMAQETHADIRKWIAANVSPEVAAAVRIQYGGSMKGKNAEELLAQPDIDGGLIGGASLTEDFFNVVRLDRPCVFVNRQSTPLTLPCALGVRRRCRLTVFPNKRVSVSVSPSVPVNAAWRGFNPSTTSPAYRLPYSSSLQGTRRVQS